MKIVSVHIPKTGGTTFYHYLQVSFGALLSPNYKRRDIIKLKDGIQKLNLTDSEIIHGHFYAQEIKHLVYENEYKPITWVRDPVNRVISNYKFFKEGLINASRNNKQYHLNKHRRNETIIEYASKEENRNRMSKFLNGIKLSDFLFIGVFDFFDEELLRFSKIINKPYINVPKLNASEKTIDITEQEKATIKSLNQLDYDLYTKVQVLNAK